MEKIKINDSDQLYEIESIRQTAEHVLQIAFAGAAPESWEGDIQLYTAGGVYRFKAIAVYYFDPSEQGAGAFDLYGSTDLSSYYDYLTFVAGIQARSLFDTGVDVGDDSRFLTVTTHSDESGVLLCITGRLIREGEAELLNTSAIAAAEEPLLAALLAEGSLPPGAAVPVWVGLDTGGERTYNAE